MNDGILLHSTPISERTLLYAMFALLRLIGTGWLILDSYRDVTDEFGPSPLNIGA